MICDFKETTNRHIIIDNIKTHSLLSLSKSSSNARHAKVLFVPPLAAVSCGHY